MAGSRQGSMGDLIVVGAGVAGLSAALSAVRLGFAVTCVEARTVGHNGASSAGWAKIFRYAYRQMRFARLLVDAEQRWHELEERTGQRLITRCPGLNIGTAGSPYVMAIADSLDAVGRRCELLQPGSPRLAELGLRLRPGEQAVLELDAGAIVPAVAMATLAQEFQRLGGKLIEGRAVRAIEPGHAGLEVCTDGDRLHADRVIVAVGPWVHDLLPDLPVPLAITAQQQIVLESDRPIGDGRRYSWAEVTHDDGYGLLNLAHHRHIIGSHAHGPAGPPAHTDHGAGAALRQQVAAFRDRLGDDIGITRLDVRTCLYTNAGDEEFVIAPVAGLPGVILLSACSGHGFKFALTNGYRAAQLAIT